MAYDDSVLLSAAADGSLVVVAVNELMQACTQPPPAAAGCNPLPLLAECSVREAADLVSGAHSLEAAKRAAAVDATACQATLARQALATEFEALRCELRELVAANAVAPKGHQLARAAFTVDAGACCQVHVTICLVQALPMVAGLAFCCTWRIMRTCLSPCPFAITQQLCPCSQVLRAWRHVNTPPSWKMCKPRLLGMPRRPVSSWASSATSGLRSSPLRRLL